MIKKNSGFTLVELLAVIVIMAIIIMVAARSIFSIMNKSREEMAKEARNDLTEVALSYVMENTKNKRLSKCATDFDPATVADESGDCYTSVTVRELINAGLFEDSKNLCNSDDKIIVYRYNDGSNSEYQAYVSDDVCNKN